MAICSVDVYLFWPPNNMRNDAFFGAVPLVFTEWKQLENYFESDKWYVTVCEFSFPAVGSCYINDLSIPLVVSVQRGVQQMQKGVILKCIINNA